MNCLYWKVLYLKSPEENESSVCDTISTHVDLYLMLHLFISFIPCLSPCKSKTPYKVLLHFILNHCMTNISFYIVDWGDFFSFSVFSSYTMETFYDKREPFQTPSQIAQYLLKYSSCFFLFTFSNVIFSHTSHLSYGKYHNSAPALLEKPKRKKPCLDLSNQFGLPCLFRTHLILI